MYKVILLNNNQDETIEFCNSIISRTNDVKIVAISTDIKECNDLIDYIYPDGIIVNYDLYKQLKETNNNLLKLCKIIYKVPTNVNLAKNSSKIFFYEKDSTTAIIKATNEYIAKTNSDLARNNITQKLQELHFDIKLVGTNYLIEAILYCYMHKNLYLYDNLEKNVYPNIAQNLSSTSYNVKHAIFRAIDSLYSRINKADEKKLYEYLNLDITEKISPKELISTIINKL